MQQKARYNGPRKKRESDAKPDWVDSKVEVEVVGVIRSHIYKKVNVDHTPPKKATAIWLDQEIEFPTHIKLTNAFIWKPTADKHPFEPPQ